MTVFAPGHVGSDASNLLLLLSSSSSFLLLLLWDSASSARNLSLSLSLASFISSLIRGTSGADRMYGAGYVFTYSATINLYVRNLYA